MKKILIVTAHFYKDISHSMLNEATKALKHKQKKTNKKYVFKNSI